jgi:hypothetical protein
MTVLSNSYDFGDRRGNQSRKVEPEIFPEDGIWKVSTKNGKKVITKLTKSELVTIVNLE